VNRSGSIDAVPLPDDLGLEPGPDLRDLQGAIERGMAWVTGMQCADGGWGAFDADNVHTLATKLPFCDFGAVIDPPSADVTAHIVEMLAAERPRGVFSRQLVVGDTLDTDNISASYDAGVLSLKIPVAEKAKPRKITIGSNDREMLEISL